MRKVSQNKHSNCVPFFSNYWCLQTSIQKDTTIKINPFSDPTKNFFESPSSKKEKKHSFSATLNDLCSLAVTAKKKILCVINNSTQSLVLLLLTAAYLSKKKQKSKKIVLQKSYVVVSPKKNLLSLSAYNTTLLCLLP